MVCQVVCWMVRRMIRGRLVGVSGVIGCVRRRSRLGFDGGLVGGLVGRLVGGPVGSSTVCSGVGLWSVGQPGVASLVCRSMDMLDIPDLFLHQARRHRRRPERSRPWSQFSVQCSWLFSSFTCSNACKLALPRPRNLAQSSFPHTPAESSEVDLPLSSCQEIKNTPPFVVIDICRNLGEHLSPNSWPRRRLFYSTTIDTSCKRV
jgi:hypothetical protein